MKLRHLLFHPGRLCKTGTFQLTRRPRVQRLGLISYWNTAYTYLNQKRNKHESKFLCAFWSMHWTHSMAHLHCRYFLAGVCILSDQTKTTSSSGMRRNFKQRELEWSHVCVLTHSLYTRLLLISYPVNVLLMNFCLGWGTNVASTAHIASSPFSKRCRGFVTHNGNIPRVKCLSVLISAWSQSPPVYPPLLQVGLVVSVFAVFSHQFMGVRFVRGVLCHQRDADPEGTAVVVHLSREHFYSQWGKVLRTLKLSNKWTPQSQLPDIAHFHFICF